MRYTRNYAVSGITPIPFVIRIACFEYGFVYITAPGFGLNRQAHKISPRLTTITIRPISNFINTTKSQTGILLETSVDSAIFILDKANYSLPNVDGMMLVPNDILGQSYIIPSFWNRMGDPRFKVIGTQDSTSVDVTFMSNMSNNFHDKGASPMFYKHMRKTYSLNYLEVLNFHPYGDPSGTIIESDKPLTVVYEDPGAVIKPNYTGSGTFDKTSTQLLPVNHWGTEYVVPPVYPRAQYLVRVFAYYNGTRITLASSTRNWTAMINRGEFEEYVLETDPLLVRGDKPISVYQYSFSNDYANDGHSSMTLVPSIDNFAKGPFTFATMASLDSFYRTFTDYVSIIIEKRFQDQIMYNGSSLQPITTYNVTNLNNYVVIIAELNSSSTVHILTNSDHSATFGLMVYGINYVNQFGFVGGMSFNETVCGLTSTTTPPSTSMTTINKTTKPIIANGKGPRCYSCTHIPHLRYCDTLQQCQEGQVCFVERHQSVGGTLYYTTGCTQEQSCQVNQLSPTTTGEKCFSCCGSNFCNVQGCGDQGFSSPGKSGPRCFDCQNFDDPTTCDRVTLCSADEVCSIEEYRWGSTEKIYKMGCAPKLVALEELSCIGNFKRKLKPLY